MKGVFSVRKLSLMLVLICLFSMLVSVPVFAAPATLPAETTALPNTVIAITNPNAQTASTADGYYTITGYGAQGVRLTFYALSTFGGYRQITQNGVPVVWTIGASRLFAQRIPLWSGRNAILVVAEQNDQIVQRNTLQITKIVQNTPRSFLNFNLFR